MKEKRTDNPITD